MNLQLFYESLETIAKIDRRFKGNKRVGWIYVMRNPVFKDNVYKVGQSSRPPDLRAVELSSSTSIYGDFQLLYFVHVEDRLTAENLVHKELAKYRKSEGKEFFEAPLSTIIMSLDRVAHQFPIYSKYARGGLILDQPFEEQVVECRMCGQSHRAKILLVPATGKCRLCGADITYPALGAD